MAAAGPEETKNYGCRGRNDKNKGGLDHFTRPFVANVMVQIEHDELMMTMMRRRERKAP